jgi:predicted transcriptional regulator
MHYAADTCVVSTRVPPEVRDELKRLAREEDRSLSASVRHHLKSCVTAHAGNGGKENYRSD